MTLLNSPFLCSLLLGLTAVFAFGILVVFFGRKMDVSEFGVLCFLMLAAAMIGGLA